MKSEPKTPLQLRAESMINEDELLSATAPPGNQNLSNIPPDINNEEYEPEELERKEVSFFVMK